ncbi:hypothetical protein TELCIR_15262 [Teladorsagia circumcincta]|uniref:Peptidase M12A domain-containing protein n=1 Tax=Teladorsagia circumcincta TaxID=45464 RepID=A0A2G9U0C7_TELCI|nr:hypothetical protein TELCIR_15262 [Teladorsagia circumcincta]
MHYDSHAFGRKDPSTGARLVTMVPLKKGVILDDNLKMSESDIAKLNRLGNCTVSKESPKERDNGTCVDTALNCERLKKVDVDCLPYRIVSSAVTELIFRMDCARYRLTFKQCSSIVQRHATSVDCDLQTLPEIPTRPVAQLILLCLNARTKFVYNLDQVKW